MKICATIGMVWYVWCLQVQYLTNTWTKVNHMMPPVQDSARPVPEFFLFPFKYFSVFLKF